MMVSVSIITFQQAATVRQAVESVLAQKTTFPFEVIVGDDASTDGTQEILEKIRAETGGRIKTILAKTNYGDNGRMNTQVTLQAAQGKYVAFLDGDDYWTDEYKLQKQVDFFEAHPECVLCTHRVRHVWENGMWIQSHRPAVRAETYGVNDLLVTNISPKIATMVRNSALKTVPEWYWQAQVVSGDWLLNVLVSRNGRIGFIDEVMADHRIHEKSVSAHYGNIRMFSDKLNMLKMLRPHLPDMEDAFRRAERHIRRKRWMARLSPRGFVLFKYLSNFGNIGGLSFSRKKGGMENRNTKWPETPTIRPRAFWPDTD